MNESYPSHRLPKQNPMKHSLLQRVATIDPMSHGRFIVLSMGTLVYAYIRVLNPPPGQRDLSRAGLIQY